MTLIIKELVIRGVVSSDDSESNEFSFNKEHISPYLEQMKKEIERECCEKILQKLETTTIR
ncbi:hypothetical protein D1816_17420 [Aquimarina sp. AD10]|uniref:Uncharacterized protein n=1 Tax=Aquimarina aggregata TaxID=1642818 RepID=A0A162ZF91_9FLAO|nr:MULTISPECIES: DUF5908 family protein [Aquimarina]AXT62061.1 hypothetical protein D1816_17420 [Aquimarina sp. AD10]KZS39760.1 hypothetical protein AWE51_08910 [Aquimarina aggregata]RKM99951.1 hypothetical protein D7033_10160 [Aquimarina sp. AD10]